MHERAAEFAERAEAELDLAVDVHEFPDGTQTAAEAADAIGCDVAQIASSLVFVAEDVVVVVTSGANRVSEDRLASLRDVERDAVRMAEPEEVREAIGWAIGGVPPVLHETDVPVYLDETLTAFETVWAAAGTSQAVFPIDPTSLRDLADATVAAVATGET